MGTAIRHPLWHRMLYCCTNVATAGVNSLSDSVYVNFLLLAFLVAAAAVVDISLAVIAHCYHHQ